MSVPSSGARGRFWSPLPPGEGQGESLVAGARNQALTPALSRRERGTDSGRRLTPFRSPSSTESSVLCNAVSVADDAHRGPVGGDRPRPDRADLGVGPAAVGLGGQDGAEPPLAGPIQGAEGQADD